MKLRNSVPHLRMLGACLVMFLVAQPVVASADWSVAITPQVDSPVTITHMQNAFNQRTANYLMCVSFTNTSPKLVTAVQFRFELYSAFSDLIWSGTGDRVGVFSQGVAIDGPQSLDEIRTGVRGGSLGGANVKLTNCFHHYIPDGNPTLFKVSVSKVNSGDDTTWAASTTEPMAGISSSDGSVAAH